jgi:hypothetical protein
MHHLRPARFAQLRMGKRQRQVLGHREGPRLPRFQPPRMHVGKLMQFLLADDGVARQPRFAPGH